MHGDPAGPVGVRRRLEGVRSRAVQRSGGRRVEAGHDAIPDQRVCEAVAPGRGVDREQPAAPGRSQRIRDTFVVPAAGTGLGAGTVGYDGRQDVLVDVLAEDGGCLDDRALRLGQGSQQAADNRGEIG